METRRTPQMSTQIILGLFVIAIGLLFILDNFGVMDAFQYINYWPALLVGFGLLKALQPAGSPGRGWGVVLIVIGLLLLLPRLDIVALRFRDIWPLILVLIGGSLIWGSASRRRIHNGGSGAGDSTVNGLAVLGGFSRSNNSQDFRGGELSAVMGGCELDLRQAAIKEEEAIINVFAFWGGVKLKVPDTWTVRLEGLPILGGFEDKTRPPKDGTGKRLVVRGIAIMGGAEITN